MSRPTTYPPVLSDPQKEIIETTQNLIRLLEKHKPHSQPRAELRRLKPILLRILDDITQ